ncbi:MAG: hypothetical protein MUF34_17510 [Polyangiaceae bacterium]|jgi:hypothetical protein|nr:hypothetical protein [Polyangiaceae bacterium]
MDISETLSEALIKGALPLLVVLIVFGSPILFFYLRWSFQLRLKELELQRELALRGLGATVSPSLPEAASREAGGAMTGGVRVSLAGAGVAHAPRLPAGQGQALEGADDQGFDPNLALPEHRPERLLVTPGDRLET